MTVIEFKHYPEPDLVVTPFSYQVPDDLVYGEAPDQGCLFLHNEDAAEYCSWAKENIPDVIAAAESVTGLIFEDEIIGWWIQVIRGPDEGFGWHNEGLDFERDISILLPLSDCESAPLEFADEGLHPHLKGQGSIFLSHAWHRSQPVTTDEKRTTFVVVVRSVSGMKSDE